MAPKIKPTASSSKATTTEARRGSSSSAQDFVLQGLQGSMPSRQNFTFKNFNTENVFDSPDAVFGMITGARIRQSDAQGLCTSGPSLRIFLTVKVSGRSLQNADLIFAFCVIRRQFDESGV